VRSAAESESIAEEYESTLSLCLYCYLSLLCVEEPDFCASPGNLAGKLALCREPRCARRDFTPRRAPGARQPRLRANKLIIAASASGVAVAPRRLLRPDHPPRRRVGLCLRSVRISSLPLPTGCPSCRQCCRLSFAGCGWPRCKNEYWRN
jgi:hypothetical protein